MPNLKLIGAINGKIKGTKSFACPRAIQNLVSFFSLWKNTLFLWWLLFYTWKILSIIKKKCFTQNLNYISMWNRKENYFRKDNCRFPFLFQSVPLVSMGIAVARRARSACTAVGPATTSPACVTACLASQEPSAMKVKAQFGRDTWWWASPCGLSSGSQGPVCSY